MGWIKRAFDFGGHAQTIWALLPAATQTGVVAVITGLTAYFGFQEVGRAQAIFYSMGVLSFGLASVLLWLRISSTVGIFRRLSVAAISIPNAGVVGSKNNILTHVNGINAQIVLRNDSQIIMFYRLRRTNFLVESKSGEKSIDRSVLVIPPNGGVVGINFSTVVDVKPKNREGRLEGHAEIEVEYGSSSEDLKYLLHYVTDIQVVFSAKPDAPPNTKEFNFVYVNSIKLLDHRKA